MIARLLPASRAERLLALGTLVSTAGTGAWATVAAVFLTRSVGLSASQVGLGLSLAGTAGLAAGVPVGHLADRRGPRGAAAGAAVVQAVASAALLLVTGFAGFVACAVAGQLARAGSHAARGALLAGVVPAERLVAVRAYQRSVTNVGFSLGAAAGGVALAVGTRPAFAAAIALDALSFAVVALVTVQLPPVPAIGRSEGHGFGAALRDRPYLAVAAINALAAGNAVLFTVGMPLWVAQRTHVSTAAIAGLVLVNTVLVVVLQVPVARRAPDVPSAVRAMALGALATAACCPLFALSSGRGGAAALAALVAAAVVLTLGELLEAAAGWTLSYALAPPNAYGQFLGAWALLSDVVTDALGPLLVAWLVVGLGVGGWVALTAAFALIAAAAPAVVRASGAAAR